MRRGGGGDAQYSHAVILSQIHNPFIRILFKEGIISQGTSAPVFNWCLLFRFVFFRNRTWLGKEALVRVLRFASVSVQVEGESAAAGTRTYCVKLLVAKPLTAQDAETVPSETELAGRRRDAQRAAGPPVGDALCPPTPGGSPSARRVWAPSPSSRPLLSQVFGYYVNTAPVLKGTLQLAFQKSQRALPREEEEKGSLTRPWKASGQGKTF